MWQYRPLAWDIRMILDRDSELAELRQLVDDLGSWGGRVVLVRGEAGIGKSAVITEFIADTEDRVHVLVSACDDLLTPEPLGPMWDSIPPRSDSQDRPVGHGRRP